jgi:serine/threonine-protein kinase
LIAGKYRLERPLATGGMGSVWVGRHAHLETQVAIKFMGSEGAASAIARARFEREAKAAAALRNRHVVHVIDYGLEGDTPYLVMELLTGEDLSKRLHRERRISLQAMSRILTQTARGLRTAHEARVVHRDLKPANIFLAKVEDEDEEIVKILDFGIAKDLSTTPLGEGTKTGELMGSPHYMSPEQVRGARDIDPRSDLWSLAVITFRALTGRLPFSGDQIGAVIAQILADPIPVATQIAPDLPRSLDTFFTRAFARDRAQRFQTAREMAETFAALAAAAPAPPETRFATVEELPTRPRMPSSPALDAGSDIVAPSSMTPASLPSVPTEIVTQGGLGRTGGGTGGPIIATAPPPSPKPSLVRWLPLAGAGLGVIIGAVAFLVARPSAPPVAAAPPPAPVETAPASAEPATTTAPSATAPAEPPAPAPVTPPPPTASASASAAASAKASAKPAASAAPKTPPPPPPPPQKKKPNWGF